MTPSIFRIVYTGKVYVYVCTKGSILQEIMVFVLERFEGTQFNYPPPPKKKKKKQIKAASLFLAWESLRKTTWALFFSLEGNGICASFFFLGALASCTTGVFLIGGLALEGTVFLFLISKREAQSPGELSFLEDTCSVGWKGDQTGLLAPVSPSCPRDCSDG